MACVAQFLQVVNAVGFTVGPKAYAVLYLREPLRLGPLRFYGGGGGGDEGSNLQCSKSLKPKSATGFGGNGEGSCAQRGKGEPSSDIGRHLVDKAQKATIHMAITAGRNPDVNLLTTNTKSDNNGTITESDLFGGVYVGIAEEAL